jgi:hypothetical protein
MDRDAGAIERHVERLRRFDFAVLHDALRFETADLAAVEQYGEPLVFGRRGVRGGGEQEQGEGGDAHGRSVKKRDRHSVPDPYRIESRALFGAMAR